LIGKLTDAVNAKARTSAPATETSEASQTPASIEPDAKLLLQLAAVVIMVPNSNLLRIKAHGAADLTY
jgi:hypothetical protein